MIEEKKLIEFAKEMKKIFDEKESKYTDDWKRTYVGTLKDKMDKQFKNLTFHSTHNSRARRDLLHIANYCYMLYNKLEA